MSVYSYLISLCILICSYLIGHILCSCFVSFRDVSQYRIFVKMTVGVLAPVVLYALFTTFFSSIFIGVCLLIVLFALNKQIPSVRFKESFYSVEWRELCYMLITFSIVSIINTNAYFYHLNPDVLADNHGDYEFYIRLSEYLNEFGVETSSMVAPYFIQQTSTFYHYYNEWFTALLAFITGMRTDIVFLSIVIPMLNTICLLGIISLSYKITNIPVLCRWGIAILLLFASGFTLSAAAPGIPILRVGNSFLYWGVAMMHAYISMKLPIVVIFVLLFLLNSEHGLTAKSFWILSLLVILWPTLIPGILGATVFWIFYMYIKFRINVLKETCYVFFAVLFLGLFYKIGGGGQEAVDWSPTYGVLKDMFMSGEGFKRMFFEGLSAFAKQIFNYSPYLLVLFFIGWKRRICRVGVDCIIYLFLMAFFSLLASMLFFIYADGFQLFLNMVQPILFIVVSFIVYSAFSVRNVFVKMYIVLLLLLSVYSDVRFLLTREPVTKNVELLSFFGDKPLKMVGINKSPVVSDEKLIAFVLSNRPAFTTIEVPKGTYAVTLSCFEKPSVSQVIEEGRQGEKKRGGNSLLYKINRKWNTPCLSELKLRAMFADLSTLGGQPFYNFVKEQHLDRQIDIAKLLFLKKYKFDILVAPEHNEWIEVNKLKLPIVSELHDGTRGYVYYKLDWNGI